MKKCVYDADSYCAAKSTSVKAVPCECEGCGQLAEASEVVPIRTKKFESTLPPDMQGLFVTIEDAREQRIIDYVIMWARRHGAVEVDFLDRDFVRSALLHEAERMKRLRFEDRELKYREISDMNSHEEEEE